MKAGKVKVEKRLKVMVIFLEGLTAIIQCGKGSWVLNKVGKD